MDVRKAFGVIAAVALCELTVGSYMAWGYLTKGDGGKSQYSQALDRLAKLSHFTLYEHIRFFRARGAPANDGYHVTVSFRRPNLFSWYEYEQEGNNRYLPNHAVTRVSPGRVSAVLSNLLVPQDMHAFVANIDPAPLQNMVTSQASSKSGHRVETITVTARGDPWDCPPERPCNRPQPISAFKYQGKLRVDRETGLPLSYTSSVSALHHVVPTQTVVLAVSSVDRH